MNPSGGIGGRAAGALERVAIVIASVALAFGAIAVLSGFFTSRDQAGVSGLAPGPGQTFPDLGHAHLRPGAAHPAYASNPPTSGPHVPVPILRDAAPLGTDQLLQALEAGNIVIMYGTRLPPPGLAVLARSIAYAFSPALAAAGQAVILAPRPGTEGLIGLAWRRLVRVGAASDPALRQFAQSWLGRGAAGRR